MPVQFPKQPNNGNFNPYTAPQADFDDDDDIEYHSEPFYGYRGRIGRIRFLSYTVIMNLILLVIFMMVGIVVAILVPFLGATSDVAFGIFIIFWLLSSTAGLYIYIAPAIRRLNDLNHTGWLSLLMLVPFVNLFLWLYLMFAKGNDGENNYGVPAKPPTTTHIMLGCFMPLFAVFAIGVLAAIALPAYQDYVMRANMAEQAIIQTE